MQFPWGIVSAALAIFNSWILAALCRPGRIVTRIAWIFLFGIAQIVIAGQALSLLGRLDDVFYWTAALLAVTAVSSAAGVVLRVPRRFLILPRLEIGKGFGNLGVMERAVIYCLASTVLFAGILNLSVIIFSAPHIWDNMVTRLPRVAYWLQNGHLGYYHANMYTQILAQKNFEIVLLYTFLASGLNENLTGLLQFLSYWFALLAVYGIGRETGLRRPSAFFAALVFGLLTQILLQASTANSDLFLAALLGVLVYSLFAFRNSGRIAHLGGAAFALGLAVGTKASVLLAAPSLVLLGAYAFFARASVAFRERLKALGVFCALSGLSLAIFALPSGYLENLARFGHPIGDEAFRKINTVEGKSRGEAFVQGVSHLAATALDFFSLDGLPPVRASVGLQSGMHFFPRKLFEAAGLPLESRPGDNWYDDKPWYFGKPPVSHPDYSYWGVLGFTLVWPAVFLLLAGAVKSPAGRILAASAVLYAIVFSFSGASWGHYLIYAAVLAAPCCGYLFPVRKKLWRVYTTAAAGLGCLSALTALLFQYRSPVIFDQAVWLESRLPPAWRDLMPIPTRTDSIFSRDRLGQLLRDGPIFEVPVRRYEEEVPPGAVVAICLNPHSYEYPLFGEKLSRKLIPINSFWGGLQPIPLEADYLIWADDFHQAFGKRETDLHLGKDWWLRKLK